MSSYTTRNSDKNLAIAEVHRILGESKGVLDGKAGESPGQEGGKPRLRKKLADVTKSLGVKKQALADHIKSDEFQACILQDSHIDAAHSSTLRTVLWDLGVPTDDESDEVLKQTLRKLCKDTKYELHRYTRVDAMIKENSALQLGIGSWDPAKVKDQIQATTHETDRQRCQLLVY